MNPNQPTNPDELPDLTAINQRVATGVESHKRTIRVLTGAAISLGFLAVIASGLIVSAYFVFYRPKEKEVLRQVTQAAQRAAVHPVPADGGAGPTPKLPFDFPSVQATMTFFHSVIITALAVAVGLLAVGILVLLAVVLLSRRATLNQINASLAQISNQLKQLHSGTSGR